jgi:hypothetical protein
VKAITARLAGEFIAALYSPGQARAPKGDPEGGRWVAEGAGGQMALDFDNPLPYEPPPGASADALWIGKYLPEHEWVEQAEGRTLQGAAYTRTWNYKTGTWDESVLEPEEAQRIVAEATENLRELNERGQLTVRRGRRGTEGVLEAGRFKTQFETGTSGGAYDPEYRKAGEARGFGIPEDINVTERPVYGYIEVPDGSNAENYGPVKFVLKPEVKRRATVTVGDSIGLINDGEIVGTPALAPGAGSLYHNARQLAKGEAPNGYIEAQIQGGVTTADVAEVVFTKDAFMTRGPDNRLLDHPELTESYARVVDAVKRRGLRYRLAPEET